MTATMTRPSLDQTLAIYRQAVASPSVPSTIFCQLGNEFWSAGRMREFEDCLQRSTLILRHLIKANQIEAALDLELSIFQKLVTTVETEEHYARCFAGWHADMAAMGRKFDYPGAIAATADPTRIAFILHSGVVLAHTELMFTHIRNLGAGRLGIVPRIYVFGGVHPDFLAAAQRYGVEVVTPDASIRGFAARIVDIRERMRVDGFGVAVWVCVPHCTIFAFSARMAPVQILWSMKFHAITDPSIDGYITWGSWEEKHKLFRGQPWEVCPVPLDVDYALPSPETIAAFRKPYGDAFILGTLARAEKMSDPEYLEAVADILLDNPNCVFLWAGRSPLPAIVEYFERRGVGQRCHFIGWVDTKLVSACFDAFLEPFPFGYGFTGFQALKAGTPLLSYVGKHTIFGVQFWDYESNPQGKPPANSAQSPVLAASSKEEYRQLAGRLVRDAEFRTAVIASEQAYFNERIANMEQYAERFFSTVHAIALRKLAGNHP